jgi:hypothetical protein
VDLTLVPKAATIADAQAGLVFPIGPVKISISGVPTDDGSDIRDINGDYIYYEGASRGVVKGQATFKIRVFRPLDLPADYLIGGAVTPIAIGNYIVALVTLAT